MLYKFNPMTVLQEKLKYSETYFHEEYRLYVKKIHIFILSQFFPTAPSPNNQPSAKVIKSLFSPFMFFLLKVLLELFTTS